MTRVASVSPAFEANSAAAAQSGVRFPQHGINPGLEALRRELIACGSDLKNTAPFQGRSFFDEPLAELRHLTCRVAFIGQVKAGKSSFINAFIRRPGLLPTDINPWTTAVTYLHFGRRDAPAGTAAQFTFFAPDEWEQLSRGEGRIRELTQRLVPGFEIDLLEQHVQAMRRRSQARLGSGLGDILGGTHAFPTLSREILERYVCSGSHDDASAQNSSVGLYSDVVKKADLYFDVSEFGLPTSIIDTPGTNDPFLVRDEITRRTLEAADIYVVMLTARQALSSADVALLRILRGLQKDRIAVFVNRIDELSDVARDCPVIVEHVRAGLRREFPTAEIPVIAGSARWAETAIVGAESNAEGMLTDKVKAYAAFLMEPAGDQSQQHPLETLWMCSGLSMLSAVLADLTMRSRSGQTLRHVCRSFIQLAKVGRDATDQAIAIVEQQASERVARGQNASEELREIEVEVARNEQLRAGLEGLVADLSAKIDGIIGPQCAKMLALLRGTISTFSDTECDKLGRAIALGQRAASRWCETSELRRQLEASCLMSYRTAAQEIDSLEARVLPQLEQLLGKYNPSWTQRLEEISGSSLSELPSLAALGQTVALDLEAPWWKRWWATRSRQQEQVEALAQLIQADFDPIVNDLVEAARAHLQDRQALALRKFTLIYMGLIEFLQEQNNRGRARARVLRSATGASQLNAEARIAELRQEIPRMEAWLKRLQLIERTWAK
jgi:signal recognition particle receptor subunit beta